MLNVYEQVNRNKMRSSLVVALFAIFVVVVVYFLGRVFGYSPSFIGIALIVSGISSFAGYWYSDKIILAVSGAKPATKKEHFLFFSVCENLAIAAAIPMPSLYVLNDSAPNAFATGRDISHAVVCATTGLLEKLDRTELEGVIAHEISHIRNYDMRLMSVVSVLVGMITLLADWLLRGSLGKSSSRGKGELSGILMIIGLVLALLSPLIAKLIQLALSRRREFLADAGSVMLTRQPAGLIKALTILASDREPLEAANKATASLFIVNPFKEGLKGFQTANMFNTHPPIEERIKALKEMV